MVLSLLFIGPIPWGHSGPLCHALSLSSLWTSMRRRRPSVQWRHLVNWRETARCGEWAQHFSNASCCIINDFLFNICICTLLIDVDVIWHTDWWPCKGYDVRLTKRVIWCWFWIT